MNYRKLFIRLNRYYDRLLLIVFILIFLIILYSIFDMWYLFNASSGKDLLKYKPDITNGSPSDSPIGEDMVAWLTIDDTNIDYPVMQSNDNTKYLNTDPYGNYSLSGSIYLDFRNNPLFTDNYSLIYGHHMEYGKMFGALDNFLKKDYMESHKKGKLIVGRNSDKVYDLEVFAAMKVSAKEKNIFEPDKNDDRYKKFIKKNSLIYRLEKDYRILALSTCKSVESDERTVVFCYILDD